MECFWTRDAPVQFILTPLRVRVTLLALLQSSWPRGALPSSRQEAALLVLKLMMMMMMAVLEEQR
ncbi:hypothetical protein NQZ68_000563 [Dissostichus eleginoides]|nr:hypothetical protein NQZ68_000563 [Dissostichus eleginoides]